MLCADGRCYVNIAVEICAWGRGRALVHVCVSQRSKLTLFETVFLTPKLIHGRWLTSEEQGSHLSLCCTRGTAWGVTAWGAIAWGASFHMLAWNSSSRPHALEMPSERLPSPFPHIFKNTFFISPFPKSLLLLELLKQNLGGKKKKKLNYLFLRQTLEFTDIGTLPERFKLYKSNRKQTKGLLNRRWIQVTYLVL